MPQILKILICINLNCVKYNSKDNGQTETNVMKSGSNLLPFIRTIWVRGSKKSTLICNKKTNFPSFDGHYSWPFYRLELKSFPTYTLKVSLSLPNHCTLKPSLFGNRQKSAGMLLKSINSKTPTKFESNCFWIDNNVRMNHLFHHLSHFGLDSNAASLRNKVVSFHQDFGCQTDQPSSKSLNSALHSPTGRSHQRLL